MAKFSSVLFTDTSSQMARLQIELMRQTPAWRKLHMVGQLNETVRTLALSGLRRRHPTATPAQLRRFLADLVLGDQVALRVYGTTELIHDR